MNRDSSIELLRLVLMVMIVIHHCIVHGLGLEYISNPAGGDVLIAPHLMLGADIINGLCICSVNCFVLISGYFSIRTTKRKMLFLFLSATIYALLFNVLPLAIEGDIKGALDNCLFLSHQSYWFITDYLFLMIFAPMINLFFENASVKTLGYFTASILIISCYFGFHWKLDVNVNGYTLFQFITMYCIGRYIAVKKFDISKWKAASCYALCALATGLLMWWFWHRGKAAVAWKFSYYNDPLLILAAVGLFMLFKNFKFENRIVNNLAKSALGIYLFQESVAVSRVLYGYLRDVASTANAEIFIIIVALSVVTALVALAIDRFRIILLDRIFNKFKV